MRVHAELGRSEPSALGGTHKSSWHRSKVPKAFPVLSLSASRSVVSDSATLWTVQSMGFSRPEYWSGIFPTQELNWGLLHCRQILYQLSHQGSPSFNLLLQNLIKWFHQGERGRQGMLATPLPRGQGLIPESLLFQSAAHVVGFVFQPWHLSTGEEVWGTCHDSCDTLVVPPCGSSSALSPALRAEPDGVERKYTGLRSWGSWPERRPTQQPSPQGVTVVPQVTVAW